MRVHPTIWILRLCWLALAFTTATTIGSALAEHSRSVEVTGAVVGWSVWAVGLVASLVLQPVALTVVRTTVPAAAAVSIVAALMVAGGSTASTTDVVVALLGVTASLIAAVCALSAPLADEFVNGAAYGDERRFALRVPGAFLVGPIPLFWALGVSGIVATPLLFAARNYLIGAIVAVATGLVLRVGVGSFHGLSRRWLVFVPAGVTLVDHLSLVDPVLFSAKGVSRIAPALAGTSATDLTHNAPGLTLEIDLDAPTEITRRLGRSEAEVQMLQAVLVTPGRPGAVMAEADRRGFRT